MTAPYTAAELAAILAIHARFEVCKPMDCWRDAAYQLAEAVPRLVAELSRAREALDSARETIRQLRARLPRDRRKCTGL
jgi:Cdc6-like AAA superfamily ATPase